MAGTAHKGPMGPEPKDPKAPVPSWPATSKPEVLEEAAKPEVFKEASPKDSSKSEPKGQAFKGPQVSSQVLADAEKSAVAQDVKLSGQRQQVVIDTRTSSPRLVTVADLPLEWVMYPEVRQDMADPVQSQEQAWLNPISGEIQYRVAGEGPPEDPVQLRKKA